MRSVPKKFKKKFLLSCGVVGARQIMLDKLANKHTPPVYHHPSLNPQNKINKILLAKAIPFDI